MGDACIFCLDDTSETLTNPIPCGCVYKFHYDCIRQWFQTKGHRECPICHTISIIVYVERPHRRRNQGLACCCLVTMIVWTILLIVFRNV